MNGHLRSYQEEATEFMSQHDRALEFDDMGLGKTLTTLYTAEHHKDAYRKLIVCGKKSLYVWENEIRKWFDKESIIYHGTPKRRANALFDFVYDASVTYLITTYGMLKELSQENIKWDVIIADEIHENGLLNHKSQTYQLFEKFARNIKHVYLLTGTPVRQGIIDLYAPLHIMDRVKFNSYWSFVGKYCITIQGPFGKEIERRPRNPEEFRQVLSDYMVRRTKQQLIDRGDLKDLPGKQRQVLEVDLSDKQLEAINELIENMFYVDGDNVIITPNKMTTMMRIRQLLVCPRMLGIDEDGAALETVVSQGKSLIENQQPFVVFTPFKQAIPFIEDMIKKRIPGIRIYKIHGDISAKDFAMQWKGFQTNPIKNKVLLCVIKSGSSFDAYTASYGFFLGYEWDFNLNAQAEDRLCRLGQTNFVNIYYLVHRGTVDEEIASRLNDKQDASNWAVGTEEQYNLLLKRYKIMKHGQNETK